MAPKKSTTKRPSRWTRIPSTNVEPDKKRLTVSAGTPSAALPSASGKADIPSTASKKDGKDGDSTSASIITPSTQTQRYFDDDGKKGAVDNNNQLAVGDGGFEGEMELDMSGKCDGFDDNYVEMLEKGAGSDDVGAEVSHAGRRKISDGDEESDFDEDRD